VDTDGSVEALGATGEVGTGSACPIAVRAGSVDADGLGRTSSRGVMPAASAVTAGGFCGCASTGAGATAGLTSGRSATGALWGRSDAFGAGGAAGGVSTGAVLGELGSGLNFAGSVMGNAGAFSSLRGGSTGAAGFEGDSMMPAAVVLPAPSVDAPSFDRVPRTRNASPSTNTATAATCLPRGRGGDCDRPPGGTEIELGFCAGVSSLLRARRCPPAGVGTRESLLRLFTAPMGTLTRPTSASAPDARPSPGTAETRALGSAGAKPVCVMVRTSALMGAAPFGIGTALPPGSDPRSRARGGLVE
jgi:hypothetical protein